MSNCFREGHLLLFSPNWKGFRRPVECALQMKMPRQDKYNLPQDPGNLPTARKWQFTEFVFPDLPRRHLLLTWLGSQRVCLSFYYR